MKFQDINVKIPEGKMLIAAMAIISQTTEYQNSTPDRIISEIQKRTAQIEKANEPIR